MTTRATVIAEARRWLGTPYHPHGRVLGVGVDCAQILCAVYEAAGLVDYIDLGNYAPDWHACRTEELYLQWLLRVGATEVPHGQPGDVAVFRFGRTWSHGGILIAPDTVLHAAMHHGVIVSALNEPPLAGRPPRFFALPGLRD